MNVRWQLQEAKNKFSQVVNHALHQGAQIITVRGKDAAVVISFEEYKSLTRKTTGLVHFFRESPLVGVDLDLERAMDIGRPIDL